MSLLSSSAKEKFGDGEKCQTMEDHVSRIVEGRRDTDEKTLVEALAQLRRIESVGEIGNRVGALTDALLDVFCSTTSRVSKSVSAVILSALAVNFGPRFGDLARGVCAAVKAELSRSPDACPIGFVCAAVISVLSGAANGELLDLYAEILTRRSSVFYVQTITSILLGVELLVAVCEPMLVDGQRLVESVSPMLGSKQPDIVVRVFEVLEVVHERVEGVRGELVALVEGFEARFEKKAVNKRVLSSRNRTLKAFGSGVQPLDLAIEEQRVRVADVGGIVLIRALKEIFGASFTAVMSQNPYLASRYGYSATARLETKECKREKKERTERTRVVSDKERKMGRDKERRRKSERMDSG